MEKKEDIGRMHTAGITIDFEYGELWRGLHRSNPLSFKKPYSFLVYKDRDVYMAEDWRGRIRFEDDDASEVIKSCVDALPTRVGGKIFIKSGLYELSEKIVIGRDNVWIIGEGYTDGTSQGGTILKYEGSDGCIQIGDDQAYRYYNVIKDLKIVLTNDASGVFGIKLYGVQYSILHNVYIHHTTTTNDAIGILLSSTSNNRGTYNSLIFNPKIVSLKTGIRIMKETVRCNNNIVIGGNLLGLGISGGIGFLMDDDNVGDTNVLAFTHFTNWDTHLKIGTGNYANHFIRVRMETGNVGIDVAGHDNVFAFCTLAGVSVSDTGSNNRFIECYGYRTVNSGVATFSGDGTTTTFNIEHGLASAPSKYVVSPLTPDADASRTITVDSTYITITFDTAPPSGADNLKFGWWAEV